MAKNPFGKSRTKESPYATYKGFGPFGNTVMHVLKTYQTPEKEAKNPYARWFIAIQTDMTYGSYDMGDTYVNEATHGLTLDTCTPEWKDAYTKNSTLTDEDFSLLDELLSNA